MRQYRDHYQPKPRPGAFNPNPRTFSDRLPPQRPRRPAPPPPRPWRPKGPALISPKEPASGKQRRRMLRAAAWRLSKIVYARPAALLAMESEKLEELIELKCPRKLRSEGCQRGPALRLLEKVVRLRR
jgi:hypothetical protein